MTNNEPLYLVWSIEHDAWWRPGWLGYTIALEEAGRYSLEEGREILARANLVKVNECLIPVAYVATRAYILATGSTAMPLQPDDTLRHTIASALPRIRNPKHLKNVLDCARLALEVEALNGVTIRTATNAEQRAALVLAAIGAIREGAGHDCEEWIADGRCELCGREAR